MSQPTADTSILDSLLARPEGGSFEVKRLKGGELSRCLQSLSAFANTNGGLLGEAYIHGMNGITEGVRQIRGTSHNQVDNVEHVLVTSGTGVPTSGLILAPAG